MSSAVARQSREKLRLKFGLIFSLLTQLAVQFSSVVGTDVYFARLHVQHARNWITHV